MIGVRPAICDFAGAVIFTPEALQIVAGGPQTTGSIVQTIPHAEGVPEFLHPSGVRRLSTRDPVVYASLRPPATFSQTLRVAYSFSEHIHASPFARVGGENDLVRMKIYPQITLITQIPVLPQRNSEENWRNIVL